MELYFSDEYNSKIDKKHSHILLQKCLDFYCYKYKLKNIDIKDIKYTKEGKPFLEDNIDFNISHSKNFWVAAIGRNLNIGIDLEFEKDRNYEKVAVKYFTDEEKHFVDLWGIEGFFRIWVIKEAIAKAKGISIFKVISSINTVHQGNIIKEYENYRIENIEIMPELKCSIAYDNKNEDIFINVI